MSKKNRTSLNTLLHAIQANLPSLQRGIAYTLEQLTGAKFWSKLSKGERTGLGIEFKAHIKKCRNPVHWVGSTPTHKQLYTLV